MVKKRSWLQDDSESRVVSDGSAQSRTNSPHWHRPFVELPYYCCPSGGPCRNIEPGPVSRECGQCGHSDAKECNEPKNEDLFPSPRPRVLASLECDDPAHSHARHKYQGQHYDRRNYDVVEVHRSMIAISSLEHVVGVSTVKRQNAPIVPSAMRYVSRCRSRKR